MKRPFNVRLDVEVIKRIKRMALELDVTASTLMTYMINKKWEEEYEGGDDTIQHQTTKEHSEQGQTTSPSTEHQHSRDNEQFAIEELRRRAYARLNAGLKDEPTETKP